MGLFERTKHLDRLARQIADENLRRLGAPVAVDDAATRRHVLELEAILRDYRLHLEETEARQKLAQIRLEAAQSRAQAWHENARLALAKSRPDLAEPALARAQGHERELEEARHELEQQAAAVARLESEIQEVERRVAALRALRRGAIRELPLPPTATITGPTTQRLQRRPPRDPLAEEIEKLRGAE